jgi:hypothetical protein
VKLNLQNMGSQPVTDLEMSFIANPALYKLRAQVLQVRARCPSPALSFASTAAAGRGRVKCAPSDLIAAAATN